MTTTTNQFRLNAAYCLAENATSDITGRHARKLPDLSDAHCSQCGRYLLSGRLVREPCIRGKTVVKRQCTNCGESNDQALPAVTSASNYPPTRYHKRMATKMESVVPNLPVENENTTVKAKFAAVNTPAPVKDKKRKKKHQTGLQALLKKSRLEREHIHAPASDSLAAFLGGL